MKTPWKFWNVFVVVAVVRTVTAGLNASLHELPIDWPLTLVIVIVGTLFWSGVVYGSNRAYCRRVNKAAK